MLLINIKTSKIVYLLWLEFFLFYISYKYNKKPIIIGSEYLYKPFKYKNTSYKHNKRPIITGSKYLYRPSSASVDHLYLKGR